MLNFPIGYGTSGHFIGAAIAAIILGPYAAILVMVSVLTIQSLVYGDGGMFSMGVNILTMAIVPSVIAYNVYNLFKKKHNTLGVVLASSASVIGASFVAAVLLGISGIQIFEKILIAMVFTHIFIGLGEGLISLGIFRYIQTTRYELSAPHKAGNIVRYVGLSIIGAVLIVTLALPFASNSPDGLEKVAIDLGFYEKTAEIYSVSPMVGYSFLGNESYVFVLASGIIGMLLTFGLNYGFSKAVVFVK